MTKPSDEPIAAGWNRQRKQTFIFGVIGAFLGGALTLTGVAAGPGMTLIVAGCVAAGKALDPPGTTVEDKPKP